MLFRSLGGASFFIIFPAVTDPRLGYDVIELRGRQPSSDRGREEGRRGYGGVVLDDCNFHENANLELFEREKTLSISAPDGEVGSLSYSDLKYSDSLIPSSLGPKLTPLKKCFLEE